MKGGTVKSNKGKKTFHGAHQGKSFGHNSNKSGGWHGGVGKKSILSQLKHVEERNEQDEGKK